MCLNWVPPSLSCWGGSIRKPLRAFFNQAFDGDEMFTVCTGISAHARELGPDLTDQKFPLFSFSNGEGSLQNVVGKLIFHHSHNRTNTVRFGRHDLFDQHTPTLKVSGNKSLLANVGSELVTGHVQHLTTELGDHKRAIVDSSMLKNKLNNIIPELVLHEVGGVFMKLV